MYEIKALSDMKTINFVVRCHDSFWFAYAECNHEWEQIDLTQGSVCNHAIDGFSFVLLVVADKVLWCRNDSILFKTFAVMPSQDAGHHRVFSERLETSAAKGTSLNIDGWA